jgi:hypothetical protein
MKIKEIKASISGAIPIASYENLKPYYEIVADVEEGEDVDAAMKKLRSIVRWHFEQEGNNAKADLIQKQYSGIRFYEKDGKKYPSVTSILGWNVDWKISEDELQQYGSRGTIVHKLVEKFLTDGVWSDPNELPELSNDVATVTAGSLALSWKDCSYEKSIEALKEDLKIIQLEQELYNDENLYAGRSDLVCMYKGKKSILDFKTGTTIDMRQLAAYAACLDGIEQLVIVPVGPTDNKSGIKKPVISTDVTGEFKKFLYARAAFRERFGI